MTIMDSNDDHDDDHYSDDGHDGHDVNHNQGCPRGGFWQLHLPRNKPTWASQVHQHQQHHCHHHDPNHPYQTRDSGVWEASAPGVSFWGARGQDRVHTEVQ